FAALVARGLLFALVADPSVVVAVQVLDGISAAGLGVMFPLVIADITRGAGRFNLALGMVGTAMGLGAALSTTPAGYLAGHFCCGITFFGLAAIATAGLALVFILMPETRPEAEESAPLANTLRLGLRAPRRLAIRLSGTALLQG